MKFLGLFIFAICLIAYFRKKSTRRQNDTEEQFWDRERKANNTRRQDISGLPYITIPLDKFPIGIFQEEEIKEYEAILSALSTQEILDLGNQTNTDLKLQYGPANLSILSECDQNFTLLCRTLVSYASSLIKAGHNAEAQTVLEFGIDCGSDLSRNYTLLADLYSKQGQAERLLALSQRAEALDSPLKSSILKQIEDLSNA